MTDTPGGLSEADRLARGRFFTLTLLRLGGVALMFVGLLIAATGLVADGGLPAVGVPIALVGLMGSLFLPRMFARRWRSPADR